LPLLVDPERLLADIDALGEIGWIPGQGLARTAFSDAHLEARRWFLDRARAAGLQVRVDSAANHSALLSCSDEYAPTLLLGSHLDSVPNGGRYDGALGVVCALEVLRTVKDAGLELPVTLEAIDFTDEEGTLVGTLGSWALTGTLTEKMLASPRGGRAHLLDELDRVGLTQEGLFAARRDPASLAAFLELHIEQGPVLEGAGVDVGVVTGIRGNASFDITFTGEARHAGTTPMQSRRDAGLGAAALMLAVRETVTGDFAGCVANVGQMRLEPGAYNVVPDRARVGLECRSLQDDELDRLAIALKHQANTAAARLALDVEISEVGRWTPVATDADIREAFLRAARGLGLSAIELPSGAGHDAQVLAEVTKSGMVFVPSQRGISHDPAEHTARQDCVNGANVLLAATLDLAQALSAPSHTVQ
jgi:beta-ureidopropionase / N-carbamoyl-L-amino-acid hydrolase